MPDTATKGLGAVTAFAEQIAGRALPAGPAIPDDTTARATADGRTTQIAKAVKFAQRMERLQTTGELDWAPQTRELIAFHRIEQAFGTLVAVRNLYGVCLEECGDPDKAQVELEGQFGPGTATPLALQSAGRDSAIVTRPDGTPYVCRRIAGLSDVEFLRACRTHGIFVRLHGAPGTGKTALVEAAFGTEALTTECDEDTSTAAIIGGYVPRPGGEFRWRNGDLTTCLLGEPVDDEPKHVWFADDITVMSGKVIARTYPALDGRRRITLKEHEGETVHATERFFAICAYNPELPGCEMPQPLRSRFTLAIAVPTDHDAVLRICR